MGLGTKALLAKKLAKEQCVFPRFCLLK